LVLARSITPAFAHPFVFVCAVMCALTLPSPLSVCHT
jgi:hypothetical protein